MSLSCLLQGALAGTEFPGSCPFTGIFVMKEDGEKEGVMRYVALTEYDSSHLNLSAGDESGANTAGSV
jgi:hypothetical protein